MKYATFKDFVREAYYQGLDHSPLEADIIDGNNFSPHAGWQTLQRSIETKDFGSSEALMKTLFRWVRIAGVITWLPTEVHVKAAHELAATENGG